MPMRCKIVHRLFNDYVYISVPKVPLLPDSRCLLQGFIMQVIAVCNTKGGVGKSTITAALAVCASAEEGRHVGVVDLDPQQTLCHWFKFRAIKDAPEVYGGEFHAPTAVNKLINAGKDYIFLDGPPAHLDIVNETIEASDFIIIPTTPSSVDLASTRHAIQLALEAKKPMLVVINNAIRRDNTIETTRSLLVKNKIPCAETILYHRVSHVHGYTAGKTAAEVNNGRDREAANEISALWAEVLAAIKTAKGRKR
jgi:chromosome partitioning protein